MDPIEHSQRRHDDVRTHASSRPGWPVLCWLFVLLAIGVVQIIRAQWFDAAVFFVATGGVILTARREHGVRRRMPLAVLAPAAAILAAGLCFLPRHSVAMQLSVVAIGVVAVVLAVTGRAVAHPEHPTTLSRGIRRLALAWAIIAVLGCVWELIQFILGLVHPDAAWFSLSDLLNPLVATVPGRILMVAAWTAGGVWLLRRGGRR